MHLQIGNIEFNDHIDFSETEEKIKNATDIFLDLSNFIDTEAENYREKIKTIVSVSIILRFHVSICRIEW